MLQINRMMACKRFVLAYLLFVFQCNSPKLIIIDFISGTIQNKSAMVKSVS